MKIVRVTIILGTLAMAGLAGGSDRTLLRGAVCGIDNVAHALSGGSAGGSCQP
ncbi:MAG TPA: hypothetical protein VEX86_23745 [Longimicrobium sp.]|nr:hypothetical protein [Longimicrobium sp.]